MDNSKVRFQVKINDMEKFQKGERVLVYGHSRSDSTLVLLEIPITMIEFYNKPVNGANSSDDLRDPETTCYVSLISSNSSKS